MTDPVTAPRRRARVALWSAIAIGLVGALLVGVLATRKSSADRLADSPLLGTPAPEIAGTSIAGGAVRLSNLRGKYVVVNFFASWCEPCREEHPELEEFRRSHLPRADAEVVAVIFNDTEANAREFFTDLGGEWPVVDDPGGRVALAYGVRGPPESFVIGPDGRVIAHFVGQVTAKGLDELLDQAEQES